MADKTQPQRNPVSKLLNSGCHLLQPCWVFSLHPVYLQTAAPLHKLLVVR